MNSPPFSGGSQNRAVLRTAAKRAGCLCAPLHSCSPDSASLRCFGRDLTIVFDGPQKRLVRFSAFVLRDFAVPGTPELFDRARTPQGALARGPDRLAAHDDVDRVGVHLGEMPQCYPAAAVDVGFKGQL